eukprot:TRINITY_DN4120_c0_g2_i1.p1 TRINITY_DN4120_c0_g2~~TRINITY_DN4120_c0_g2_i1.p1  ORF type:complete len:248 (+),score=21.90 TRINITY_DN4120_c0_g2_i1:84-746(+)
MSDVDEDNLEKREEVKYELEGEAQPLTYCPPDRDCRGKATYSNGDVYEGEFHEGKRWGRGIYKFRNLNFDADADPDTQAEFTTVYEGDWVNGVKHGVGQITYPDSSSYHGEWSENKKHGQGVYRYVNGDIYEGGWLSGLKHGPGLYKAARTLCEFHGVWNMGQLTQGGVWKVHDQSNYTGGWRQGRPSGEGIWTMANGNQQEGIYTNGKWKGGRLSVAGM